MSIQSRLSPHIPQALVVLEAEDDARQHPPADHELGGRSACSCDRKASRDPHVRAPLLSCAMGSSVRSSPVHCDGDPALPAESHDASSHVQVVLCDFEFPYYGRHDVKHIPVIV